MPPSRAVPIFCVTSWWVTPYEPKERYAAGDYPVTSSPTGDGLPGRTAADRNLVNTDLVRLVRVRP